MNSIQPLLEKYGLYMTVDDLAEVLKCHPQTLYNRLAKNDFEIPAYRNRKRYLFSTHEVVTHINENTH